MNIQPLYDKVLVRRVDEETKTAGGIIIPDNAQEKPCEGIVEAVGEGFRTEDGKILPMAVKAGDRVLFAKWGGTEVKAGGESRLIIKESDILAVVK